MKGGRYLAEERGAFEAPSKPEQPPAVEAPTAPATAPLYEVAAVHDGQPPEAWLGFLMAWCERP